MADSGGWIELQQTAAGVQFCCSKIIQASQGSLGPTTPDSPVVLGSLRFRSVGMPSSPFREGILEPGKPDGNASNVAHSCILCRSRILSASPQSRPLVKCVSIVRALCLPVPVAWEAKGVPNRGPVRRPLRDAPLSLPAVCGNDFWHVAEVARLRLKRGIGHSLATSATALAIMTYHTLRARRLDSHRQVVLCSSPALSRPCPLHRPRTSQKRPH